MSAYDDYLSTVSRIKDSQPAVNADYERVGDAASTLCDVNQTMVYNPNMSVVYNRAGDVIGYDYKYTTPTTPNPTAIDINSNNDTGFYGASGGGGTTSGGGAGRNRSSTYSGGIVTDPQSTNKITGTGLIAGAVDAAWAGVAALGKLGRNVASATADALDMFGFNFGVNFGGLTLQGDWKGGNAIRALFGIDENNNTAMYLDGNVIGALAIQARDDSFFQTGGAVVTTPITLNAWNDRPSDFMQLLGPNNQTWNLSAPFGALYTNSVSFNAQSNYTITYTTTAPVYFFQTSTSEGASLYCISTQPFGGTLTRKNNITSATESISMRTGSTQIIHNNTVTTIYYGDNGRYITYGVDAGQVVIPVTGTYGGQTTPSVYQELAILVVYGQIETHEAIPGTSDQPGATIPVDAITGADPHVVAENLVTNYPDVMGSPVQVVVMDDACNEITYNYYKVTIPYAPTGVNITAPVTGTVQLNPDFNPNIELPDIDMYRYTTDITLQLDGSGGGEKAVDMDPTTGQPKTNSDTIPNTGSGTASEAVMPETGVVAMWNVYNPSSSELSQFGSWLWAPNIVEQIKRLLDNPMDAIIGVHAIYGAPTVGGSAPIVVGNIAATVSARVVTKQYTAVDCGSVSLTEYFGNIFDYPPYTQISIFLPFVGIVPLDVDDVMRAVISVKYNVDVYTGACIAMISVERDGAGGILYQYSGNCAISYPISGNSYSAIYSAVISAAMGIASVAAGVSSGNPAMVAGGAGATLSAGVSAHRQLQRSGSFTGNSGAMGPKVPYLIITRPQVQIPQNTEYYEGFGTNEYVTIGTQTGFIRCKDVHLIAPNAFDDEINEIYMLLRQGIIIQ